MTDQEILKLIKRATSFEKSQEVKRSSEDLVGQVLGCYKIGYNDISGALFYRDSNNIWQPVKLGSTGGGGGVVVPVNLQQVTDVGNSTTNNIEIRDNVNQKIGLYKADGIKWDYGDSYQILNPQNVGGQYNELLLPRYNGTENPSNLPRVLGQTINNLPFDIMGNIDIVIPSPVSNNFANADLTANNDRLHNFAGNNLQIKNIKDLSFTGGTTGGLQTIPITLVNITNNLTGQYFVLTVPVIDNIFINESDVTAIISIQGSQQTVTAVYDPILSTNLIYYFNAVSVNVNANVLSATQLHSIPLNSFNIDLKYTNGNTNQPQTALTFDKLGNGYKTNIAQLNKLFRFGIEDNLGVQDRAIDFDNYKFEISKLSKLFIGSGIYNGTGNPIGEFVYDFDASTYGIDMQVYSGDFLDYSDIYAGRYIAALYSSRGIANGSTNNAYSGINVRPEVISTYQVVNGVSSNLMLPFLDTSARPSTYLALSVNGNYANEAGNITIDAGGGTPVIPFYNNNLDAITNGAAQNSMYRLPYLAPGDYYPLALVGPLQLQTFALTMGDNCNIVTLSANVVMTNTLTNNVYNFVLTRSTFNTSFNPITVTILQGSYSFTLSNI